AKAQGFYGENTVLAAYYRAFQLLAGITFPLEKPGKETKLGPSIPTDESLRLGLSFYRAVYRGQAFGHLKSEQQYLSDTGPENYAANLNRIIEQGDPLLVQAITGNDDLNQFIAAHKTELVDKLASDPYVGKTPEETRINIAGTPVDFFESGRPSGFTVLSLIAALDGQIIQNVGNEKTREFIWNIKKSRKAVTVADVPAFLKEGAANIDWVNDMFEGMADRDLDTLTAVEQLYKAGGMVLKQAKNFSPQAYALYKMLVASDYILKAEETVKARQRPIVRQVVRTRGGGMPRVQPPSVYVPAMPQAYQVLASATQKQLNFLERYFENLPAGTPQSVQTQISEKLQQLNKLHAIFSGLYDATQEYQGRTVEEVVPVRNAALAEEIFNEWVSTGNLANAKPVAFPAMEIGINDQDTGFVYQGQVMFMVGGAQEGAVRASDGTTAPFALYHLWRMVKSGGETVTTAEHTLKINDRGNAEKYKTEAGVKEVYDAEYVEFYNPLATVSQPQGTPTRGSTSSSVGTGLSLRPASAQTTVMNYNRVMTQNEIDRRIDEIPRDARPGIGFRDPTGNGALRITLTDFELEVPVTDLTAFSAYQGDLYVAYLESARGLQPAFARIRVRGVTDPRNIITELQMDELPASVRRDFGMDHAMNVVVGQPIGWLEAGFDVVAGTVLHKPRSLVTVKLGDSLTVDLFSEPKTYRLFVSIDHSRARGLPVLIYAGRGSTMTHRNMFRRVMGLINTAELNTLPPQQAVAKVMKILEDKLPQKISLAEFLDRVQKNLIAEGESIVLQKKDRKRERFLFDEVKDGQIHGHTFSGRTTVPVVININDISPRPSPIILEGIRTRGADHAELSDSQGRKFTSDRNLTLGDVTEKVNSFLRRVA
ncbi:hypothetical protein HY605_04560, partial [Candidatus Peregrinibacteria bacterium]|nr:hypothetical protein [Candidatus Peregrinibacteria bacterium]